MAINKIQTVKNFLIVNKEKLTSQTLFTIRKGLGKKSAYLLSKLSESNKNLFTSDDAIIILKEKSSSVTKLLHDLVKNNWLYRISKGKYLILPLEAGAEPKYTAHEFVLASVLTTNYYVSYWSALNYYGLTEQVPKTVFIATTKQRNERKVLGITFRFVTLRSHKFFGFKTTQINNHPVNIAEKEKAIIDCLDQPRNCGGIVEVIKAIDEAKDELDFDKLITYAKKMKNSAILNRLGYILELLNLPSKIKPGKYYIFLEPLSKKRGAYCQKWKIIENLPKEELLSWREH